MSQLRQAREISQTSLSLHTFRPNLNEKIKTCFCGCFDQFSIIYLATDLRDEAPSRSVTSWSPGTFKKSLSKSTMKGVCWNMISEKKCYRTMKLLRWPHSCLVTVCKLGTIMAGTSCATSGRGGEGGTPLYVIRQGHDNKRVPDLIFFLLDPVEGLYYIPKYQANIFYSFFIS